MSSLHKQSILILLSLTLLILGGAGSLGYAETVQEAGIPGAVKFEAVFPHLAWGNSGGLATSAQWS